MGRRGMSILCSLPMPQCRPTTKGMDGSGRGEAPSPSCLLTHPLVRSLSLSLLILEEFMIGRERGRGGGKRRLLGDGGGVVKKLRPTIRHVPESVYLSAVTPREWDGTRTTRARTVRKRTDGRTDGRGRQCLRDEWRSCCLPDRLPRRGGGLPPDLSHGRSSKGDRAEGARSRRSFGPS